MAARGMHHAAPGHWKALEGGFPGIQKLTSNGNKSHAYHQPARASRPPGRDHEVQVAGEAEGQVDEEARQEPIGLSDRSPDPRGSALVAAPPPGPFAYRRAGEGDLDGCAQVWQAAVEACREHPVHEVARELRLN